MKLDFQTRAGILLRVLIWEKAVRQLFKVNAPQEQEWTSLSNHKSIK
jgi:hypothetical protein